MVGEEEDVRERFRAVESSSEWLRAPGGAVQSTYGVVQTVLSPAGYESVPSGRAQCPSNVQCAEARVRGRSRSSFSNLSLRPSPKREDSY